MVGDAAATTRAGVDAAALIGADDGDGLAAAQPAAITAMDVTMATAK
jgi:hypothetical protein